MKVSTVAKWIGYNLSPKYKESLRKVLPDSILKLYRDIVDEYYLISYPKCGRTWLRLLIGKAISIQYDIKSDDLLNLRALSYLDIRVPKMVVSHNGSPAKVNAEDMTRDNSMFRRSKVILMIRDPRDVLVSLHFHVKKRWKSTDLSVSDYIRGRKGGIESFIRYYNTWDENWSVPKKILLVRYESLHGNTQKELRRIFDFLGMEEISDSTLAQAVEYASFKNMNKMESEKKFTNSSLQPVDQSDRDSYKTRRGVIGGYVDYLTEDDISFLDQQINQRLSSKFNY